MKRQLVKSSNIKSVGYDKKYEVLEVEFKTGKIYAYHEVPPLIAATLFESESIGKYFNDFIRDKYKFIKDEWEVPDFKPLKGIYPMPGLAIVEMVTVLPKNISSLITPSGDMAKSKTADYSEHPVQGIIVAVADNMPTEGSITLKTGDLIAMNTQPDFVSGQGVKDLFVWNGKHLAIVKVYNIICILKK